MRGWRNVDVSQGPGRLIPRQSSDATDGVVRVAEAHRLALGAQILVGDCDGVDGAVQDFLSTAKYTHVTVYHISPRPRHNRGFTTVRVRSSRYEAKDIRMCRETDYGLAIWDGQSPGTRRNIQRVPQTRVINVKRAPPRGRTTQAALLRLRTFLDAVEHGEVSLADFPPELRAVLFKHLRSWTARPSDQSSGRD
jgi:hypothetical protein